MKKYYLYFFLLLISLLDIFIPHNILLKITLLLLGFLIIFIIYKNKIPKHFYYMVFCLVIYFIFFFFFKYYRYDLTYAIKNIYLLLKIFSGPLLLYFIMMYQKEEDHKKTFLFIILLSLISIIKMFVTHNLNPIELIFYLSCLLLITKNSKLLLSLIIMINLIVSLILKNNLYIIYALILIIINLITLIKEHALYKKYILSLIFFLISIISLYFINFNQTNNIYGVINNYEFPKSNYEIDNINNYQDIIPKIKASNLSDLLFGFDYHLINLEQNFITIFLNLGLFGFLIYLIIMTFILKKPKNLYFLSLIIFLALTNLCYNPFYYLVLGLIINEYYLREEEMTKIFALKKIIILVILCLLSFIISYLNRQKDLKLNNIEVNLAMSKELDVLNDYNLKLMEKEHHEEFNVKEDISYYHLKKNNELIASVIYSKRIIDNVTLDFLTIKNNAYNIKINLKLSDDKLTLLKAFDEYNEIPPYSTVVGLDKKLLPIGYFKDKSHEMIISRSINYKTLTTKYDGENKSVIYDLISQESDLKDNQKEIIITPYTTVDTYFISSDKLFQNEDSITTFINILKSNSSWLTYKGNLYKVQYSIDPFTREGYSKILGKLIESDFYETSLIDKSSIFKSLSDNAIYNLYNYTPRNKEDGLFLTEYTSTWLSKDYGTKAYYIDTRYNETIGYHLLNKYEVTKEEKYLKTFLTYADFINDNWQKQNGVYKVNDIYLMQDYFASSNNTYTHSSLNHQLALINYLFKAYEVTNDKKYYDTAKSMLDNILKFKDEWIKDNHDLWYQVNKDGIFSGTDYEIVTLEDLIFTQNYLWKFDKEIDNQIMKYLDSKVKYLQENKKNIPANDLKKINEFKEKEREDEND